MVFVTIVSAVAAVVSAATIMPSTVTNTSEVFGSTVAIDRPAGNIAPEHVVNMSSVEGSTQISLRPPDVALRTSTVDNLSTVDGATTIGIAPPDLNLRPEYVANVSSVEATTVQKDVIVTDAALSPASVQNDSTVFDPEIRYKVIGPVLVWDRLTAAGAPELRHDSITLRGNKTASSGENPGAISAQVRSSGRQYFEFMFHNYDSFGGAQIWTYVALVPETFAIDGSSATAGATAIPIGFDANGNLYTNSSTPKFTFPTGTIYHGVPCAFAVDLDAKLVWVRAGDKPWNNNPSADPATGVGGYSFTTPDANMKVFGKVYGPDARVSLFGGENQQAWDPPAGFRHFAGDNPAHPRRDNFRMRRAWQAMHMETLPSEARWNAYQLFDDLISLTVYPELDVMVLLAAHDEHASRYNWVDGRRSAPNTGVAFVADRYRKGSGTSSSHYLMWRVLETGKKFQNANAHMGVWSRSDLSNAGSSTDEWYLAGISLLGRAGAGGVRAASQASAITISESFAGHSHWSKTGTSRGRFYKNGVFRNNLENAHSAPPTGDLLFYAPPQTLNYGINELTAVHAGSDLGDTKVETIYYALMRYLYAIDQLGGYITEPTLYPVSVTNTNTVSNATVQATAPVQGHPLGIGYRDEDGDDTLLTESNDYLIQE